jgi:hypothetical protein
MLQLPPFAGKRICRQSFVENRIKYRIRTRSSRLEKKLDFDKPSLYICAIRKELTMLIKMGAIVTDVRGSLGGHTFSRNTYGPIARTKVTPVNRSTTAQQLVRGLFTAIAQAWRGLTDAQRAGWNSLAQEVTRTNIFGDSSKLTSFNLFLRLNRNITNLGGAIILDAPAKPTLTSITSLTLVAKVAAGLVTLAYAPTPVPAGFDLVISATPQMSPGISFVKSEYRKLAVVAAAAASPYVATTAYAAMFGTPVLGNRIFFQAKLVHIASGFDTGAMQTSTLVIAS